MNDGFGVRESPAANSGAPALTRLPIARYRFTARFHDTLDLPEFSGSMLRSVFGLALRNSACVTGQPECRMCPLWRSCQYPAIFETPPRPTQFGERFSAVPNPFVIEPPPIGTSHAAADRPLVFHMVLIGSETLRQLPLVVRAWQRALQQGLGPERVRASLSDVALIDPDGGPSCVWDAASATVRPHDAAFSMPWVPATGVSQAVLDIRTPMRLQQDGRALRARELSARTLVSNLLRRINLMLDLHLDIRPAPFDIQRLLAVAESTEEDRSGLRWFDWTRYSARQRQEMTLGGVLGCWILRGDIAPLAPWLVLGQFLHLGKNATMGMGGYVVAMEPAVKTP
jgi:hypothetical protein